MMRKGRLVAEESPDSLLQKFNTDLLEDVFLKLCRHDKAKRELDNSLNDNTEDITDVPGRH